MSKNNKRFLVVEHAKYLQRIKTAKRLGVSTKLFENKQFEKEIEEEIEEGAGYFDEEGGDGRLPLDEMGHEDPRVGGNKSDMGNTGLEEMTVYGDDAKQEVGHEAKQGKQQAMQSVDEPTGVQAGSRDPGLRKKGGNRHKEKGLKEDVTGFSADKGKFDDFEPLRKDKRGADIRHGSDTKHPTSWDVRSQKDLDDSEDDMDPKHKGQRSGYGGPDTNDHSTASRRNYGGKQRHGRIGEDNSAGTVYGDSAKQEVGHEAKQGKQQAMQSVDEPTGVQAGSQDPGLRKKGSNSHKEKGMLEGHDELNEAVVRLIKSVGAYRKSKRGK